MKHFYVNVIIQNPQKTKMMKNEYPSMKERMKIMEKYMVFLAAWNYHPYQYEYEIK